MVFHCLRIMFTVKFKNLTLLRIKNRQVFGALLFEDTFGLK